jgi:hypothetical protein
MKITTNELAMLLAIRDSEFHTGGDPVNEAVWSDCTMDAARDLGLASLRRAYAPSPAGEEMGATRSIWMVLASDPAPLEPLAAAGWAPVANIGVRCGSVIGETVSVTSHHLKQ